ncbi:AAA family ATPase [Hydrogenophaga soli]
MSNAENLGELHFLSFFNGVWLWSGDSAAVQLHWRYRKTPILLALVAAQRGRAWTRARLAELLWPKADASQAKANLRVLLVDLQSVWRSHGLPELWRIDRQQVCLLPGETVWFDAEFLVHLAHDSLSVDLPSDALKQLLHAAPDDWLVLGMEDVSDDAVDWVQMRRDQLVAARAVHQRKEEPSQDALPNEPKEAVPVGVHLAGTQWRQLVLWRIESAEVLDADELGTGTAEHDRWTRACAVLLDRVQAQGAKVFEQDEWSVTLALGLSDGQNGQRWRTLGLIQASWAHMRQAGCEVSMAVVAGWVLVEPAGLGVKLQGWRLRLLSSLALWAEVGHLACGSEWSELIEPCTPTLHRQVKFRDVSHPVDVWSVALNDLVKAQLPVGVGSLSSRFVGRLEPLGALKRSWSRVSLENRPAVLRVRAPSGWGKTRLAAEFAKWVGSMSSQVWWLGAQPELRSIPWSALHLMLLRHLPPGDSALTLSARLQSVGVQCTARVVDVLLQFLDSGGLSQSDVDMLVDLLATWWGQADRARPEAVTLVVIDDAQWLDEASAALLARVASRQPRLLWVLTERHPLPPNESVGVALKGLDTQPPVELGPLADADAAALLDSMPLAESMTGEERQRRIAMARGIPLFLMTGGDARQGGQSPGFVEHCEAMLNRLGQHQPVLRTAALLGMRFAVQDMVNLAGEDKTVSALRLATQTGLLVMRDEGYLAFFHPALREYLMVTYVRPALQADSARVAEMLQERGEWSRAALLWQQAHRPPQALTAWRCAVNAATAHDDLESALTAHQAIRDLGGLPGVDGLQVRAAHVRALLAKHGYAHARAHALADELVGLIEASPQVSDAELKFEAAAFHYLRESGRSHAAALIAGERMVREATTASAQFTASWSMANAHFWRGEFVLAAPWFDRMVQSGAALPRTQRLRFFPSDPMVFGLMQRAWMCSLAGEHAVVHESWTQAAKLIEDVASSVQDKAIYHTLSLILSEAQGDFQAVAHHVQQALLFAQVEGFELWFAFASLYDAQLAAAKGKPVDLMALGAQSEPVLENYESATPIALWLTARCLEALGETELALGTINVALDRMSADGGSVVMADAWWLKASLQTQANQEAEAAQSREAARKLAQDRGWHGWLQRHGQRC